MTRDQKLELVNRGQALVESTKGAPDVSFFLGYGEGSYPKGIPVALANWNDLTKREDGETVVLDDAPSKLGDALEEMGFEIDWSDEWVDCAASGLLYRSQGDSYHWRPSYWFCEEDNCNYGIDAIKADRGLTDMYLDSMTGGKNSRGQTDCVTFDLDFKSLGYVQLPDTFENGFFEGQADDPETIIKWLNDKDVFDFFFHLSAVAQFDTKFEVWMSPDDLAKIDTPVESVSKDKLSPAQAMKNGLSSADIGPPVAGKIKHVKLFPDGSAEVSHLTPRELLDGLKK